MNILPKEDNKELHIISKQVLLPKYLRTGEVLPPSKLGKKIDFCCFCLDFRISDKEGIVNFTTQKHLIKKQNSTPGSVSKYCVILGKSPKLSGFRFFSYRMGDCYCLLSYVEVAVKVK